MICMEAAHSAFNSNPEQKESILGSFNDVSNNSGKLRCIYETIFDNPYEGILVVDENGYIVMINRAYCEFLGVDAFEVIGKHVTKVVQNTRLHIVIKTRKPEVFQLQK